MNDITIGSFWQGRKTSLLVEIVDINWNQDDDEPWITYVIDNPSTDSGVVRECSESVFKERYKPCGSEGDIEYE